MTEPNVSLVIPGRNCAATIARCLDSVTPLLHAGELGEIIFVDDGSTDETRRIVQQYPAVALLEGAGRGPGYARNLGWRESSGELVWFIDSDCVARPDALARLQEHMRNPEIAGVGGSYDNLIPGSLLATLIHEEIVARHRRMPTDVDFLASFNVLYRRSVLEATGGFDESLKLAQDAELAYRIRGRGKLLRFDRNSRVGHHHPVSCIRYLRTQLRHGYFRMRMYARHPGKVTGDSYAGWLDFAQPPLAMLTLGTLPLALTAHRQLIPLSLLLLLAILQIPFTIRIAAASRRLSSLAFALLGIARAYARGVGMIAGLMDGLLPSSRSRPAGTGAAMLMMTTGLLVLPVFAFVIHLIGQSE